MLLEMNIYNETSILQGVHEESAEVCCSVQHCLKRHQLDDANGSCLHHLTRCTKLLHQLQGTLHNRISQIHHTVLGLSPVFICNCTCVTCCYLCVGMACSKELADVLCNTSIAYLQLYLLTRCHYRGGLGDCNKEIRTILNKCKDNL